MGQTIGEKMEIVAIDPMKIDQYYFPVNSRQFEILVGKVLTQLEAMNLNERAEKANKDIAKQMLWNWWNEAQENSLTSSGLCIGPIFAPNSTGIADGKAYQWLTEDGVIYEPKTSDVSASALAKRVGVQRIL